MDRTDVDQPLDAITQALVNDIPRPLNIDIVQLGGWFVLDTDESGRVDDDDFIVFGVGKNVVQRLRPGDVALVICELAVILTLVLYKSSIYRPLSRGVLHCWGCCGLVHFTYRRTV